MLDDEERAFVQDRGWDSLRTVGVAGIRDGGTKCLHEDEAHFLEAREKGVAAAIITDADSLCQTVDAELSLTIYESARVAPKPAPVSVRSVPPPAEPLRGLIKVTAAW